MDQFPLRAALPSATSRVISVASRGPIARAAAKVLTAGSQVADAVRVSKKYADQGMAIAWRPLPKAARTPAEIVAIKDALCAAMDELAQFNTPQVPADLTIDVATFGILAEGVRPDVLIASLRELGQKSRNTGVTLTLTISEPALIEAVYVLAAELRQDFPEVGVVVPTRLRRGADDIVDQARPGHRVRLDTGRLDAAIGLTSARESGNAFVDASKQLLQAGAHVGFDTDEALLLDISASLVERFEASAEVVAALGTLTPQQQAMREHGWNVRVVVPYGDTASDYVAAALTKHPSLAISLSNPLRRR